MEIGFLKELISKACKSAVSQQQKILGFSENDLTLSVEFEKIHNDSYCSREGAPGFKYIREAHKTVFNAQIAVKPMGWQASCDARLFAKKTSDVVTFGAGSLELAHGPEEFILTRDILSAAGILFLAIQNRAHHE
jgi:acetylornithine deacetylase/succinyl-diaminopimelate desuccinylase-like protein